MTNILEYLENTAAAMPDKKAAVDENGACTYGELMARAKEIGSFILGQKIGYRRPVVCFMEKSVATYQAFMGIVYAGDFYVLMDPEFPVERLNQILGVLEPQLVITVPKYLEKLGETCFDGQAVCVEEILGSESGGASGASDSCVAGGAAGARVDEAALAEARSQAADTDPLYCNFTSGSTGVPKGVVICHRSVIDFIDCFTEIFGIGAEDVVGNQAPFDFDVSVKDMYSCLKTGATLVIIPRPYFMQPAALMDMLDDNGVTTLIWAVSALCMLNRLHGLKYKAPATINKIMFSGEVMPIKQLNQWKKFYPDAMYVNLYGPTEITCNCTYYILDREFDEAEKLPMGVAFPNEKVMLLDVETNQLVTEEGGVGEVCVAGTCLALGYYNNPEQTGKAFVQNPLNSVYPETIYRTGDLAEIKDGVMYFAGRKDFQIKHMGHRIELEEIELAIGNIKGVERVCCFFDEKKNKIVAFYVGDEELGTIVAKLGAAVPEYMVPNVWKQIDEMPLTKNGKMDRKALRAAYEA